MKTSPHLLRWLTVAVVMLWPLLTAMTIHVDRQPETAPPAVLAFVAGVGKADITPPPGVPLFGYSRAGNSVGAGFRTRVYARAIYLQDTHGERVALVQCDLGGISALLQHSVARLIAKDTGISDDRLLIGATHTHSGPGGFFGVPIYDDLGAERVGFDPKMLDFMSERIAGAVKTAFASRKPAKIAIGQIPVFGLSRNRSIEGYVNNRTLTDPSKPPFPAGPEYEAIDPALTMIRVDRIDGGRTVPIGAFTNFAVHGTVVPSENDLYSGDVQAGAERALEWEIEKQSGAKADDVVNVLTNANEGDVEAAYTVQGFSEASRIGLALGDQMIALFNQLGPQLTDTVTLSRNYVELKPSTADGADGSEVCEGSFGFPAMGGAQGGRSGLYYFGRAFPFFPSYAGARRSEPEGCQGYKIPAFWQLQSIFYGSSKLPDELPIQAIQINDLLLIGLPGEFTTEMGRRIKAAARQAARFLNPPIQYVAIAGLANQYASYYTTPEEFDIQNYEGGSTLFGPHSGSWIATNVRAMVATMSSPYHRVVLPDGWTYETGIVRNWFEPDDGRRAPRQAHSVEVACDSSTAAFSWHDTSGGAIHFDEPLVMLESQQARNSWQPLEIGGVPVDDRGLAVEVRLLSAGASDGGAEWKATWYAAPSLTQEPLRFVILERKGEPALASDPFKFDCKQASSGDSLQTSSR
ncbi:MAG TPA: neutral/alkaline non-lysosomal ceramidase N-terminal domain-containing protein [Candidatus Binataceae bacterium]|nr:neutral/alkaline non-lysosomal ceramidase N-terminal domain-containing protein [Candidatus Binataceae bacterium]